MLIHLCISKRKEHKMQNKIHNLFISHSWSYSDAYDRLIELLDSDRDFEYKNYSVPKDDPIHNAPNAEKLAEAIENQIVMASAVIILAGVYATYSKWINKEIAIAKRLQKKIIAIEPWGSERTSAYVKDNADIIVGWNTASIIDAIKGAA